MVAAVLPIIAKLNIIIKSEIVNTWEFWHLLGEEVKVAMILTLKNIYFEIILMTLKLP